VIFPTKVLSILSEGAEGRREIPRNAPSSSFPTISATLTAGLYW
jgi:hypothetical protein